MTHHVYDQLSAYMDGRANNPQAIEQHLGQCAQCRAYLDQLRSISAQLRDLTGPAVKPEFATRVMGAVRQTRPEPRRPWFIWLGLPVAATAAVILVLTGLATTQRPPAQDPTSVVAKSQPATSNLDALTDETDPTPDELISALSQEDWFSSLEQEWESQTDIESIVDTLTAEEIQVLEDLLRTYQNEEAPI